MDKNQQITEQINEIKDRIRRAPALTPNINIYEWYLEIEELEKRLDEPTSDSPTEDDKY